MFSRVQRAKPRDSCSPVLNVRVFVYACLCMLFVLSKHDDAQLAHCDLSNCKMYQVKDNPKVQVCDCRNLCCRAFSAWRVSCVLLRRLGFPARQRNAARARTMKDPAARPLVGNAGLFFAPALAHLKGPNCCTQARCLPR
jgi:hypothetical protein